MLVLLINKFVSLYLFRGISTWIIRIVYYKFSWTNHGYEQSVNFPVDGLVLFNVNLDDTTVLTVYQNIEQDK